VLSPVGTTGNILQISQFSVWRFISEVFRISLIHQPQDVVVMKLSWCEDHGSRYHQTVKMVIISIYHNQGPMWIPLNTQSDAFEILMSWLISPNHVSI